MLSQPDWQAGYPPTVPGSSDKVMNVLFGLGG